MLLSMCRELIEDIRAHNADKKENNTKITKLVNSQFQVDIQQNIEVGDIIRIEENDVIPADLIILSTSHINKLAFVETISLDGEKNLKPKYALPQLKSFFNRVEDYMRIRGSIVCDLPNADLNKFNGILKMNEKYQYFMSLKNFLNKGKLIMRILNIVIFRYYIKKYKMGYRCSCIYRYGYKDNGKLYKEADL